VELSVKVFDALVIRINFAKCPSQAREPPTTYSSPEG
jgi:hypothetical protein